MVIYHLTEVVSFFLLLMELTKIIVTSNILSQIKT